LFPGIELGSLEVKRSWELQRLVPWRIYPRYENVFHI